MRKFKRILFLRAIFLLGAIFGVAWLVFQQLYLYAILASPIVVWLLVLNFRSQVRTYKELEEFAEAARYRDFSRNFPLDYARAEIKPLRSAFNDINAVFRKINTERETQFQYLQKILEVVNTAILSYDEVSGKVMWMNDSFRDLFNIPHLGTIGGLSLRNKELQDKALSLTPGKIDRASIQTPAGKLKLQLASARFQTAEGTYRLVAFQNINEAIDETEAKAWQKLLSVLTHEIMNSIAPISSLADTLKTRLEDLPYSEDLDDIRLGTDTIKRRSEGLLKFAGTYRSLNKVSEPDISEIAASTLFENLYQLMEPSLIQKNIELDIILKDPQLKLTLDVSLIEQVLINLLLNAIEAVKEVAEPLIKLSAELVQGRAHIKVSDNGKGIPADLLENIFIPFFTTRKNGSGVGLTLSKQIMLMHKGNIQVQSSVGKGTVFTLVF
ncbi:sensor histidine kinase [Olivibacter sitiensis]|uniref:sensor histidine kinase n=1 Tax=Olivibacter sitiensis TaxID=376470 RepID=UPI000426879C|nr:ATP-binding protein [Olivibacter sitiensis]